MTKTRKTNGLKVLTLLMMVAMFVALFCTFGTTTYASAATTPKYTVHFEYTAWYKSNTAQSTVGSATDTTSAYVRIGQFAYSTYSVNLWGSGYSGTGDLPVGGYINSSSISAQVNSSNGSPTLTIKNSSGTSVASGTGKISASGLADGTYTGTFGASGGWLVNNRQYDQAGFNASFTFKIDTSAPSISGASTSTTGKYTNGSFTVSASDTGSGVQTLYYKTPTDSSYQSTSATSKTFASGSTSGLYSFYAVDRASNRSSTYYVVYDGTGPTGTIKNSSGTTLTSTYTNTAFNYTATDASSGLSYCQYKTPGSSSWQTYTAGTNISASATNGKYTFRSCDKAGNFSAEKSITLDTTKPVGTLYGGTSVVANGGKTNASYVKFLGSDTLSGVKTIYVKTPGSSSYTTYTSGSQLAEEGTYVFYCTDYGNNTSANYTITVDRTAPTLSCSIGSFYETTGGSFTVSASDSNGVSLYYKTPSMSSYSLATGSSYTVSSTGEDGRYYFYASDSLGSTTSTVWVELSVEVPVFNIIKSSSDNSRYITWDENYTVTVNGNSYTKNSWIRSEGQYNVVATNTYGRSTTKVFTIDHYYLAGDKTAPTCTGEGYTTYSCVHCGGTYNSDTVDAVGHTFDSTVSSSSCTEGGITTHVCRDCGYTYQSNSTAALGHTYSSVVTEPTCTAGGYTTNTCTRCNHTYTSNATQAVGHRYAKVTTAPTCTMGGYSVYSCRACEFNYTSDYTEAVGHNYRESYVAPGCGVEGYTLHACSRCADEYKTDFIPATGHTYVEEAIPATCEEEGGINHICTVCAYTYKTDVVPAVGHSYTSSVIMYSTCTTDGERQHRCENCGDNYLTVIPAMNHHYELLEENNNNGTIRRVYGCSVCGNSYVEDIGEQYEEVSNFVIYLFDEYSPYMIWVFLATAGIWSIAMGVAMIVAHKNEDKEKAKKMLVNYLIGLVVIFGILVACPYLVKGIAVLVT